MPNFSFTEKYEKRIKMLSAAVVICALKIKLDYLHVDKNHNGFIPLRVDIIFIDNHQSVAWCHIP